MSYLIKQLPTLHLLQYQRLAYILALQIAAKPLQTEQNLPTL